MNLVLHIVRKDFLRMRGWLGGWVVVLMMPLVLGGWLIAHNPLEEPTGRWRDVVSVITGLQLITAYVLTVFLFQEDNVVGTQRFWLTRPISAGRLLLAKTIGALMMFALIPVIVALPWWLGCGFGPAQVMPVAVEMFAVFCLPIIAGALIASLTDSLPRAMLWTLVLAAVVLFGTMAFTMALASRGRLAGGMSLAMSRGLMAVVLLAVEFAAVVALQFFVRRRGGWLGLAGLVVLLSLFVASRWPQAWIVNRPELRSPERAAGIEMQYLRTEVHPHTPSGRNRPEMDSVSAHFRVSEVPAQRLILPLGGNQTWRWGAVAIKREPFLHVAGWPQIQERALGLRLPTSAWPERTDPEAFMITATSFLPPSQVAQMRRETPTLESLLWFQLGRSEIRCEVPTNDRASRRRAGVTLRIADVQGGRTHEAGPVQITGVLTAPATLAGLIRETAAHDLPFRLVSDAGAYGGLYALHHGRGEFVPLLIGPTREVIVHGVRITWLRRELSVRQGRTRDPAWLPPADWRDEATVAAVWIYPEAVFSRESSDSVRDLR